MDLIQLLTSPIAVLGYIIIIVVIIKKVGERKRK